MRAADTNVLVRSIVRDDPKQTAAAAACIVQNVWVSHVVLVETMWVLASLYDFSRKAVAETLTILLDHKNVTIQEPDVVEAALELYKKGRGLAFIDCVAIETARKAGHLPLCTFDKDLAAAEGAERLR